MKHLKLIVVILISLSFGCLIKPPAEVKFELDTNVIGPGDIFHLIVTINNTGKVGILAANLQIEGDDFILVGSPKLTSPLKVGESTKLIWTIKGPAIPGTYTLKVYLDIVDELHRTWRGNIYETRIKVVNKTDKNSKVNIRILAPNQTYGGKIITIPIAVTNNLQSDIRVINLEVNAGGLKIIEAPKGSVTVPPNSTYTFLLKVKTPPEFERARIFVILEYGSQMGIGKKVSEKEITVLWQPWMLSEEEIREAYGNISEWVFMDSIVDRYWENVYGSTSIINRQALRESIMPIINGSKSDIEAAKAIFNYIFTHFTFEDKGVSILNPQVLQNSTTLSPIEANLLMVAYLRSINVPARVISVYNGVDCTEFPFVEAYISGKWYVIDFKHMFFGTREEFISSRWFPTIYQEIGIFNNKLVAIEPGGDPHNHEQLTQLYLGITKKSLLNALYNRLDKRTYMKVKELLALLDSENERIFALFLFTSGSPDEVENLLNTVSVEKLSGTIKAFYEFYYDIKWEEDFRVYWEKLLMTYR
ncbi:transglutaminase domain-containing protein [Pyrococcus kukulkanii]|uniref:transglutaminase domain-containing protein n=1 Tax=Pyrococcus kukulkanii TaxID=1609559 RepID=UPI0035657AF7